MNHSHASFDEQQPISLDKPSISFDDSHTDNESETSDDLDVIIIDEEEPYEDEQFVDHVDQSFIH